MDIGKISPIAASLVRLGNIDNISGVRTMTHQHLHTILSNLFIYCFLNTKVKSSSFLSYKVCNVNFYFYEVHSFDWKYLLFLLTLTILILVSIPLLVGCVSQVKWVIMKMTLWYTSAESIKK